MVRVALAISRDRNRELVASLFADHDVVTLGHTVPDETALCIVDERGLDRVRETLDTWRDQQHPLFAPVLLLVRSDTTDPWEQYADELSERIDAIMQIPTPKRALATQAENLLEMRDVSTALLTEQQLNERIFETSPLAKVVLDPDGNIVRANERAEDVLGLSRAELTDRAYNDPDWQSVGDDGTPIPDDERPFTRVIETGEPVYDYVEGIEHPDGDRVWLSVNMAPIRDEAGDIEYVVGALDDITVRRQRERELQRMTRAVDKAPIGITLSDPDQDDNPLIYVNDGFVNMTGYAREEAIGRNCRFLQGEHTDPETVAEVREAIDAEEPVSVVIRNYRADGTEFWNRLEIAPIHDADGTLLNYIGFQQDVTDRIERQRQLEKLDQYLRHNIRNEMNIVGGLAEQIQRDGDPPITESAARIYEHSTALMETMEKEREIVRLLGEEPVTESIAVLALLQSLLEEFRDMYPDATFSLSGSEPGVVRATPQLRVALEELIRNAVVHTDREPARVEVSVAVEEDGVVVRIADNGPGIPPIEREVLTSHVEETQLAHGQGLGLWLVHLIIRRSGGRIQFEANEPRGSIVTVVLSPAQ